MFMTSIVPFRVFIFLINISTKLPRRCLVGVRKTTHTRHHAENVVVERIDAYLSRAGILDRVDGDRELERGLVDTGEVACA